jgi:hypothetical protein
MPTLGTTKIVLILTPPLNPGTSLNVISSEFSYSFLKTLEIDDEVIIVGKLYYSTSNKGSMWRPSKRQKTREALE